MIFAHPVELVVDGASDDDGSAQAPRIQAIRQEACDRFKDLDFVVIPPLAAVVAWLDFIALTRL